MYLTGKITITVLLTTICLVVLSFQISAQQPSQTTTQSTSASNKQIDEETKNSDLAITANVTAKELKFEIVPNPNVEFTGRPERKTVWESDRQNLPRPVEPGVTYRNIGIQLRISSRFADIERIVAEALGEIPISNEAPLDTTPKQPINKITEPVNQNKKP